MRLAAVAPAVALGVVVGAVHAVEGIAGEQIYAAVLARRFAGFVGVVLEAPVLGAAVDAAVPAAVRIGAQIEAALAVLAVALAAFLRRLVGCRWEDSACRRSLAAVAGGSARLACAQDVEAASNAS